MVAGMDKSIRISPESHAALKKLVPSMGTLKAVADRAIDSLDGVYVVFEGIDFVEVYQHEDDAFARRHELTESGIGNVTVASRAILDCPDLLRSFGPRWKDATGWTPVPETVRVRGRDVRVRPETRAKEA